MLLVDDHPVYRDGLELLARERRNGEIAAALLLSERSVRNYVSNILTKLDADDRAQVITVARDAGLGLPPIRAV